MKNILIIEDDPFTIDFYLFIFKKAGFNPIVIEDGDKVIEFLTSNKINLIIMDINLKNTYLNGAKIDGIKLSNYIKTSNNMSQIPIMLVTAYSPSIRGENFYKESLAEDFITKPIVDFNLLINKVNNLIKDEE
ncbi:MAG: response regulator [Bacteroidetes bacterium]|nr:response regulator [Bacteroidota bacterium]